MEPIGNFRLDMFSNSYYNLIDDYAKSGFETVKLLGQFYTHYSVIQNMIESLVARISFPRTKLSIIVEMED